MWVKSYWTQPRGLDKQAVSEKAVILAADITATLFTISTPMKLVLVNLGKSDICRFGQQ